MHTTGKKHCQRTNFLLTRHLNVKYLALYILIYNYIPLSTCCCCCCCCCSSCCCCSCSLSVWSTARKELLDEFVDGSGSAGDQRVQEAFFIPRRLFLDLVFSRRSARVFLFAAEDSMLLLVSMISSRAVHENFPAKRLTRRALITNVNNAWVQFPAYPPP